jgi:DNA-binding HxlR family transcriptional regulator
MVKADKKRDTGCPVAFALDTFGDRWSLLIIRDIVLRGSKTYGDFLAAEEGIATNVLADRLRELEDEGIIRKSRDPENHRKFNYALTEKGCDLVPVILEMILWSAKYDPNTKARKEVLRRIEKDRAGFVAQIRARFLGG